ncbi:conserved protein of unknown function [Candidatus Promineifilum breve]|uniref:Uncharacterized protein n=1 Tax=Candidatus Promineifilum breve TaxID=1806508 RepID=A0A160T518_9CHLR|nr:hypothetical protein [Candidatus Promineifilum breve]CUS04218.2 conserved protein of unknown function [Candidatus Promineifilum breve]
MKRMGVIYEYHLDAPLDENHPTKPGHYLGFCEFGRLAERDRIHHKGQRWEHMFDGKLKHTGAARFLAVAVERNIGFQLVRAWRGTRDDERRLKKWKNGRALCPICNSRPKAVEFMDEIGLDMALAEKRRR